MRHASLVLAWLALAAAGPAAAGEAKPAPATAVEAGVDLRPVAAPVVVDGQVRNYVFVTVRLLPFPTADISALRDKEQFFRDALVRAGHRTPFTLPTDYNRLDERRIVAAVMAASPAIAGRGQVRSAVVTRQQPKNIRRSPRPLSPVARRN